MKRHPSLIPLSREHHEALILAQLLKKDAPIYKGLPTEMSAKKQYAFTFFQQKLLPHFKLEELIFQEISTINETITELINMLIDEHEQLKTNFLQCAEPEFSVENMHHLGVLLQEHIRKEERVLFQLVQMHATEDILQKIAKLY
ncbi:MAG: hemerythrin domain-containing protein [Chitinophagaceae bacterium]